MHHLAHLSRPRAHQCPLIGGDDLNTLLPQHAMPGLLYEGLKDKDVQIWRVTAVHTPVPFSDAPEEESGAE